MSPDNALAELRASTRTEHDRIEQILRLDQPMPLQRYAAIVAGFDAFLRAWEPRIHAALPERLQAWYRPRRRGGFASADADWLREVAGLPVARQAAPAVDALSLDTLAEVLGSLYVIEGSALGGRVIAPRLKRSLGLDQGRGASYFHGFGGEAGAMWNNFRLQAALEIGDAPPAIALACASARRTFAALTRQFVNLAVDGPEDDDATRPAPLADIHIDLPADGEPTRDDTLIELPLGDGDGGDTLRMPL